MAWLKRLLRLNEPAPVERTEEAANAKEEAHHRKKAAEEVLRIRERTIVVNHIATDIGRAYALTVKKGKV